MLRRYRTKDGKDVDVDINGLDEWGLPFESRVKTKFGPGMVVGCRKNNVFVLLDTDTAAQQVCCFFLEDIGSDVVSDQPDPPKIKAHPLKLITYKGRTLHIVMQKERGPCPIFAVVNALALQGQIELIPDYGASIKEVTLNLLLSQYFRTHVDVVGALPPQDKKGLQIEVPNSEDGGAVPGGQPKQNTLLNTLKNRERFREYQEKYASPSSSADAIESVIARLYDGLDLDVIFSDVEEFLMERDVIFFPLFGLRIFHGWVIGEQMRAFQSLQFYSYNELTTMLVTSPVSDSGEQENEERGSTTSAPTTSASEEVRVTRADHALGESFFVLTSSVQMTEDGYNRLGECIDNEEIGVLFWQNHFFTVTKLQGRLVVLLTDDSFSRRSSFVFATIAFPEFTLNEFLDHNGNPIDPFISYIAAHAVDEYSDDDVRRAQRHLGANEMEKVTPQLVLEHLMLEKKQRAVYNGRRSEPTPPPSKISMEEALKRFLDVFPEADPAAASALLKDCKLEVEMAIEKHLSSC